MKLDEVAALDWSKNDGLISFDESVRQLFRAGLISRQVAEHNVRDVGFLNR